MKLWEFTECKFVFWFDDLCILEETFNIKKKNNFLNVIIDAKKPVYHDAVALKMSKP